MNKINTIMRKEWAEIFKNRMVLFTVIFMPLMLTAIPLAILYTTRGSVDAEMMGGDLPEQMNALCPADLSAADCFQVFMVSQFMIMFMLLPLIIPATIAAYSIVGEKTTRSLEPLLATPITTIELLLGKALAAIIPAVLATFGAFAIFAVGAFILIPNRQLFLALMDARWLLAVILVGPLMALMAVSFSMMVSSRVNDPRVAEQFSMVIILPVLAVFFGQIAGLFVVNSFLVLVAAAVLVVLDALLIYFAVHMFQREAILTRWK
jgi:ABC-2 type transport system permease protein